MRVRTMIIITIIIFSGSSATGRSWLRCFSGATRSGGRRRRRRRFQIFTVRRREAPLWEWVDRITVIMCLGVGPAAATGGVTITTAAAPATTSVPVRFARGPNEEESNERARAHGRDDLCGELLLLLLLLLQMATVYDGDFSSTVLLFSVVVILLLLLLLMMMHLGQDENVKRILLCDVC